MGWKLRDDTQELCCSLDYLLDSVQALKASIRTGRRLDGEGGRKVNSKELWCQELSCPTPNASLDVKDVKAALRRMKDTKGLLSSLLESIDVAIQNVTNSTIKDVHGAGLSLLPDDLLACIFEMYVNMYEIPDYEEHVSFDYPALIISSICRRFRQIALGLPDVWKHVALFFPKKILALHKERCQNPVVHIKPASELCDTYSEMLHEVQPFSQWRGLEMHVSNGDHARLYFECMGRAIFQTPFHSLEYLSISNELEEDPDDVEEQSYPIYLFRLGEPDYLTSWQMPKLARLHLRNVHPKRPLLCENVTQFHFEISRDEVRREEPLSLTAFRRLLGSMPKMQSLSVIFDAHTSFESSSRTEKTSSTLTSLTSLNLKVAICTSQVTVSQFMDLIETHRLTSLNLAFEGDEEEEQESKIICRGWIDALFPGTARSYANVERFGLEFERLRGSNHLFGDIFESLPNVKDVSLVLPHHAITYIQGDWIFKGAFEHLRSLRIDVTQEIDSECPLDGGHSNLDALFEDPYCKQIVHLEVHNRLSYSLARWKANLQGLLGERLEWVDYERHGT
ncbi:hypothetical protein SCHPADRAFT_932564 [Schizopora paradoxa]|uniref:F-box domain-containing protein n=1 Tax=Schizopora paradoxa TaxID=27342 RepID=A0A0H2R650_9AGAM|nr:hypothetical protein SCHPADRAFT_932564 [Schizopora paradoxa]